MSNSQSTPDWLNKLEEQSRISQQAFMDNISTRLRRPRMTEAPDHPYRGTPAFWSEFEWDSQQRIDKFTTHFQEVGGHVVRLQTMEQAAGFIADHAVQMNARYLIRQQQPELAELRLEERLPDVQISSWNSDPDEAWKARAAEADIGVVMADGAAAYTGTVMVTSTPHQGRSVSLLPTVCIVILPVDRLYTRLGELLIPMDEIGREHLPAGMHFISGPSRSSDIENDLTIGVHGPGIIYTLLVG
ncbi:LutC/YkgG family protein [Paenibacillus shenyangensis]|uniref:LutC/YkgG family protein n=1 Tax=Paenibacillus sp. A9 TaxID=1284352 RepID=UPI00035DC117|nr:lactate utilization protein [Paenibacillus sp. A9]